MSNSDPSNPSVVAAAESVQNAADFLSGGGELGKLIRAFDWSKTSLGPISQWPQSMKTALRNWLRSPVPIVFLWGPDGIMIYNDAYSAFAEGRHPHLLGSKVREGWPEVADFNDNVLKVCLSGGTLSYRDFELTLYRKGLPERVWLNLDYSPVLDESGRPAGVLAVVMETTGRVLAERALAKAEEHLNIALRTAGTVGTFDWDIQNDTLHTDAHYAAMFSTDPVTGKKGVPMTKHLAGIHPDDREGVVEAIGHAIATGEKCTREYRVLRKDGAIRWIKACGECKRDKDGRPGHFIGVVMDITEHKEAEERQRLLLRETNHRIKNLFAIFHGMIRMSARSARTPQEMAASLVGRLETLMRAKDLVRPGIMGTEKEQERTTMDAVVRTILKPYEDDSARERIVASGPPVPVGGKAATSLALALHESATNAAKYGALSEAGGSVRVEWGILDSDLYLEWEESGGPPIIAPPQKQGFGSVLAQRSITDQLGGKLAYDWRPTGLLLQVTIPLDRLGI